MLYRKNNLLIDIWRNTNKWSVDIKNLPSLQIKWQPTQVFLSVKSHGERSLTGYSPWGCTQSNWSRWLSTHKSNKFKLKLFELFLTLGPRKKKNVIQVLKVDNEISSQTPVKRANWSEPNGKQFSRSLIILFLGIWKKKRCTKIYGHRYASHPN